MTNLRRLLPSFRGLVAFEAAGRLGSFSRAGQELAMTQSAVSYAIKGLEEEIGQPLFERGHREVSLTIAGERLHAEVSRSLGQLADGISAVRTRPSDDVVTLSVSTAFATLWIAPRLQMMRTDLPDVELRLHTADRDLDLVAEDIPLGIRGGRPRNWPTMPVMHSRWKNLWRLPLRPTWKSTDDPIIPVIFCSITWPIWMNPYRYAATWKDWLRSAGVSGTNHVRGTRANEYVAVLQMALDGDAVALGWRHLVEEFIRNGRLCKVTDHTFRTGNRYYVVHPKNKQLAQNCQRVRDWILNQDNAVEDAVLAAPGKKPRKLNIVRGSAVES